MNRLKQTQPQEKQSPSEIPKYGSPPDLRQAVHTVCGIPWHAIKIGRLKRGKPYLATPDARLKFNVSHQGDLVVLATSMDEEIGVDVMRIDESRAETATEHINFMSKLFSESELQMMQCAPTEREKWTAFYRIWCLKESVLKATGTGMVNDLRVYDFRTTEERHSPGCYITSTTWHEHGVKQPNWIFEESFIGDDHCVAVGRMLRSEQTATERELARSQKNPFTMVTFERLLDESSVINPLEDEGIEEFSTFVEKPLKPF
ncbi:4'-phosphopantetheinyl transferase family protein [Teladorsagia circumcincta]|uniref:L-aminoadipate-semialdehyde dehydrogenase-phosphopantetheinyl transferase n=1 Tax=Teladorsagia circumcincta TaxID=45464 RepID=A0A2G9U2X5_TELCI|nr:4'-phosphopantetheinyl transferase family protein [Teladorsagia circumcincta]